MIYKERVTAYKILVKGGKMTLTADDNKSNLPVVPESYQEAVAEALVK